MTTEVRIHGRFLGRSGSRGVLYNTKEEGPLRITITYGQPHTRERQVAGNVVPYGRVWQFGANLATILYTDVDLILGGTRIPPGLYSLYALPTQSGWYLIVNAQIGQWDTDYDPSKDFVRIPLQSHTRLEPAESFTIYLIPDGRRRRGFGTLKVVWGTTELTAEADLLYRASPARHWGMQYLGIQGLGPASATQLGVTR